jgi:hypothetical protein
VLQGNVTAVRSSGLRVTIPPRARLAFVHRSRLGDGAASLAPGGDRWLLRGAAAGWQREFKVGDTMAVQVPPSRAAGIAETCGVCGRGGGYEGTPSCLPRWRCRCRPLRRSGELRTARARRRRVRRWLTRGAPLALLAGHAGRQTRTLPSAGVCRAARRGAVAPPAHRSRGVR